ncbi:MAG: hypothetical protein WDN01_06550 [Rhizomicrobium sp.]
MSDTTDNNHLKQRAVWIALLMGAIIVSSVAFACATPLAAVGALAALFMRRTDALALTLVNWLANQFIGYVFLHYPQTPDSFGWGAAMGIGALLATGAGLALRSRIARLGEIAGAIATFAACFVTFELALYAATAVLPAGGGFTPAVILYVLEVNGIAFAGLLAVQSIGMATGLALRPAPRPRAA